MRSYRRILIQILAVLFLFAGDAMGETAGGHGSGHSLDEVVVTADRISEYITNYPQQVTVVSRAEIGERNLNSLEEVLKTMPGVEVYPSSGIGSRISIRGSGKSGGVLVLLNGRPLNSNQYGGLDLNTIPVDIIESVTVFKPPIPVWLGPGGSEGAINIVTREESVEDTKNPHTTLKVSGGSYGFVEGSVSHRFQAASGNGLISATGTHLDGKRLNSDRSNGSFGLSWSREGKEGNRYELNGRYYQAEYGSSGPDDNLTPDARQEYRKGSLDARYRGLIGEAGTFTLNPYADLVRLEDRSQSGFISTLEETKLGLKVGTTWSEEEGLWEMRLDGIGEWNGLDHTLTGSHHRTRTGLSGQYDRRFGSLTGTLGLRGDYTDDFGFDPAFSGGIGWGISERLLIKARAGYTVNVPTFAQLYQTSHGSIDQTRGNPDLTEEKVWSYDLGVEYTFAKDRLFQATLFRADTEDLILYQRGADKIYRPLNIPRSWRQGVELAGKYRFEGGPTAEISLTLQDSANKETGKDLPYTPAIKLKTTLQYTLPGLKTRMEGTVRYEGSRFSEAENLRSQRLASFVVVDLKATQPFTLLKNSAEWYIKIDNLLDASFESHYGYPDDGLRFVTGMQMKF